MGLHGARRGHARQRSPDAVTVRASLEVVRAFIRLRALIASQKELAARLDDLERRYDRQFKVVFDAIRTLIEPEEQAPRERIGFKPKGGPA